MTAHPEPTIFLPMTPALRRRLEAIVDQLIGLLDQMDGDPDLEPDNDNESSLGWTAARHGMGPSVNDANDDQEAETENDEVGGDAEPDADSEPRCAPMMEAEPW